MNLMLGKLPAAPDSRDLLLGKYLRPESLPSIPSTFGHQTTFPKVGWGMLGNDEYGDCAIAGPAHETMLLTKLGGYPASFSTQSVLSDYSRITGFDPNAGVPGSNPTDQGSNVRDVARFRRSTGMIDALGHRHKIAAFVAVNPGVSAHVRAATYLFETLGIGFQVPSSAMDQFQAGQPWTVVHGSPIEGGHYVCGVGCSPKGIYVITWGTLQLMSWAFFAKYCDESYAYLSTEDLKGGKSPEGFNLAALQKDLAAL